MPKKGEPVPINKLILRRWNIKEDGPLEDWVKKPVYTIEYRLHRDNFRKDGASFAQSQIGAANKVAQTIGNNHDTRIQLVCNYHRIPEDLYHAARFMVDHHNAYIDTIDPVIDVNPFKLRRRSNVVPQHIPPAATLRESIKC